MTNKSLKELKKLWNDEKNHYKTAEVGSGVQKFVKEVFKSEELFGLAEGKLSTADNKRDYEFLEETKKKGRRADVVIFIDRDIVIPVEVEKYGNIKAGIGQLFQYQADWVKKYGILTDGDIWRFYNNHYVEKIFKIEDVLKNPKELITFWNEYIQPEYYYKSFFEKRGQLKSFDEKPPELDKVREDFFTDITKLIENFRDKLNLKGYFKKEKDEKEKEKKATEITYAYLIQFILYKVLVDNAFEGFEDDWNARMKNIDKAIKNEIYGEIFRNIKGISDLISDKIYKRFNDEQLYISERLGEIMNKPVAVISDVSVWLDILLFISRYNFANVQNEIFGYVYENYLKQLYEDVNKGQYFTDPQVVEFMLNEMGYTKENLQKRFTKDNDSISIIDPSCGSGTFLYNSTNRIMEAFYDKTKKSSKEVEKTINDNIFGFDIAEFPLYLAEMNILMRMLPLILNEQYNNPVDQKIKVFKTKDSIAEFLDTAIRNTITDIEKVIKTKGGIQLNLFTKELDLGYTSFMRDKGDLNNLKESLENKNKKPRYRFDFVVGNPPYISFKECSRQKIKFFELQIKKVIKMSDIYGVNLNTVPGRKKAYAPNPNLYAYFIALGLALLKDKGTLCYIIPQNILTTADLDVIRYHLSQFVTIKKIINFSCNMFIDRGLKQSKVIPTSSLILILTKIPPTKLHEVEIINYTKNDDNVSTCIKNINRSMKITRKKILQNNLRQNIDNWNYIKFDKSTEDFFSIYDSFELFDIYRLDYYSIKNFGSLFYFDRGLKYEKEDILESELNESCFKLMQSNQELYTLQTIPKFINKTSIVLPKGAQGYKVYEAKYKIIWRYMNTEKFIFSDENIMINYNWVLISSDNRNEMVYIFSLLNSSINSFVFKKLFSNENEKSFQIGIKSIKEFCHIPQITTSNSHIKNEVISCATELLAMEKNILSDLVDFKNIMLQKFDQVEVIGNNLSIKYKEISIKCRITGNAEIVKKSLQNVSTMIQEGIGNMSDLKEISAFDPEYQAQIKDYIDDLVFSLYFKVKLPELGFKNRDAIKKECAKHKFYELVNKTTK